MLFCILTVLVTIKSLEFTVKFSLNGNILNIKYKPMTLLLSMTLKTN